MSIEKRLRILTVCLVGITLAEIFLALIALLENSTLGHVALIYGTQLVLFDGIIISTRQRLKRELQGQSGAGNQETSANETDHKTRIRLGLYILVNASIPIWTMYFAGQFPMHLKIVIAIISLIFMNVTLFLSFRSQDQRLRKTS
jgi:hypothetical protein